MSTEIAIIEIHNPLVAFSTKGGLDAVIDKIESDVKSVDRDISTESGRDNIRSLAFKLAKSKKEIERMGLALTEGWRDQTKLVNEEKKRASERMQALQDEIRAPLTAYEDAEKLRVSHLEGEVLAMTALLDFFSLPTSAEVQIRIDLLKDGWSKPTEWAEFSARASAEHGRVLKALTDRLADTLKAEADAAELERLRKAELVRQQKERDDRIAEKARAEADARAAAEAAAAAERSEAARKRLEAEKQAVIDKAAADAKAAQEAADKAERDRIAAEKKAEADKLAAVEAERRRAEAVKAAEEAETRRREADKAHKTKINNEALEKLALVIADIDIQKSADEKAKVIITAIAKGEIPNVTIKY